MACSMVHVLIPSGKCDAWKCSQHTRPLGARCCGQAVPLWKHSLVGENRSPYRGTSFAFARTLECPALAQNCFCSVPLPNYAMWWERLGGFNLRTIHRMSVSTLGRIYSFVGGVLRLSAYRLPHPHCGYLHARFKSFRVYSLSLGRSHPLAQHVGVINATSPWQYRIGSMRVCGDNFAVACEQGLYISVWNWKSGEHISDFVCSVIQMKWYPVYADREPKMALLQTPVFTFLDEYHILCPGWAGDSICVYDVRAMPPINTKKTRLKGTHCFEIPISQLWGHELEPVCSIALDCNSLTTGVDSETAVPGVFCTDPHDRVVSLRIIAEFNPNPTRVRDANWPRWHDHREIHAHAQTLLMWTQAHPAPRDACSFVPWSAWGPAAARVVPPRMNDDSDVVNMRRSQSRFSGCGMRIVSTPYVRSDGITNVTVTDYHPARVIRGRKQDVVHRTNATPTEIEGKSGQTWGVADAGRRNPSAKAGGCSRLRPKRLPLSTVSILYTPCLYC
jgi:hypothetical protein